MIVRRTAAAALAPAVAQDSGCLPYRWGERGRGACITVDANRGHASVVVAGLRFDTSGRGGKGPRRRAEPRPSSGFTARHPAGL